MDDCLRSPINDAFLKHLASPFFSQQNCSTTSHLQSSNHLSIFPPNRHLLILPRCRGLSRVKLHRRRQKPDTLIHVTERNVLILQGLVNIHKHLIRPLSVPLLPTRRACDKAFGAIIGQVTKLVTTVIQSGVETLVSGTGRSGSGMGDREAEGAFGADVDGLTAGDFCVL